MASVCVCVIAVWLTVNSICLLVALYCGWQGRPQKKPTGFGTEPAAGRAQLATIQNTDIKQPPAPRCFGCARPMQLIRRTPRFGGLADLYVFRCRSCDE